MKTPQKVDKNPTYTATLLITGKKYIGQGNTVAEAVSKIEGMGRVKTKSILVVESPDSLKERILQPAQTYRLFNSVGLMREIALKNVSLLF